MDTKKVILVTGSSSGFGRLTIETLAWQGHQVYASMRDINGRNAVASDQIRELAERENLAINLVELDVTDDVSVDQAISEVINRSGRVDVLVNNAGFGYMGPTETFTLDQIQQQFDTNFFGVARMNRAVLPYMRGQGSGLLMHVSSIAGRLTMPFMGIYSASKFAVESLAEAYRYELSSLGIDSVIVEPGAFPTSIFAKIGQPADHSRLAEYGDLAKIPQQMGAGLEEMFSGDTAPVPQEVADAIAKLVATPAGRRPLRTLVGQDAQAATALNQVAEQAQEVLMEMFGLSDRMSMSSTELLAA
ncbi:MAG: short-chain dehydrogenase/reductase [SAR202 cluster bacterium Io17-Chloro-G5]|nr:MAG: short-chain dehydrogenase/reductase [SAR202 cluster bacterium Io17-Chloro-G5]